MAAELQVSKSILAKLLAAENITVSHQATKTAYFDLKSRTLVCPVWKDMDGDLYDLLMGHEVGHALETPAEGWHNALDGADADPSVGARKFKSFLNVLEDARIEKKVKRRFPGLAKSFANAYKDLYERNFFGVKNIDVNKLNLIDRINLKFKLGAHMHVPFNDLEREMVKEVDQLETWEEVEALARRVFDYVKSQEQDKIQTQTDLQDQKSEMSQKNKQDLDEMGLDEPEEDFDESDDEMESDDAGGEPGDADGEDGEDAEDNEGGDREDQSESDGYKGSEEEDDGNPESITDREFRKREEDLVNHSGKVVMAYLPEANLEHIVIKNHHVMDALENYIRKQISDPYRTYGRNHMTYDQVAAKCTRKFNNNNKKFITHILKEFDMRKKATAYARTQTARTGELDMNVLHKYKFNNDLFKKISVVPKGKNHGMILFLDMSGSMGSIFRNTIEQLLVLVSFCKMGNIPFDVYGFSDSRDEYMGLGYDPTKRWDNDPNGSQITNVCFHLKHLIGSSLSPANYRRSFNNLAIVANEYYRGGYGRYADTDNDHGDFDQRWAAADFGLNGTPFVETLLASREIIKKFRADHHLDITNVIYLTDGEGGPSLNFPYKNESFVDLHKSVIYLIDKKTKKKVRVENSNLQQAAITELVRQITDCKHIGYYLADDWSMRSVLNGMRWSSEHGDNKLTADDIAAMKKSVKENRFFVCSNLGYDKYFYMSASTKKIEDDQLKIDDSMTKNKITQAFKKTQLSKRSSRVLVSKFAEEIATAI